MLTLKLFEHWKGMNREDLLPMMAQQWSILITCSLLYIGNENNFLKIVVIKMTSNVLCVFSFLSFFFFNIFFLFFFFSWSTIQSEIPFWRNQRASNFHQVMHVTSCLIVEESFNLKYQHIFHVKDLLMYVLYITT